MKRKPSKDSNLESKYSNIEDDDRSRHILLTGIMFFLLCLLALPISFFSMSE